MGTCSDLGHRVEGGKWITALLASDFRAVLSSVNTAACPLPSPFPLDLKSASCRRATHQPRFGSRLSYEVGTHHGDVSLTSQRPQPSPPPPSPHVLAVWVKEAENLLEGTREAQGNVWLFLKY